MQNSKIIHIVTANDYLIYQPTILNVYDELIKSVQVQVVSFEPNFISKEKDQKRNTHYIRIPFLQRFLVQNTDYAIQLTYKFLNKFGFRLKHEHSYYHKLQMFHLDRYVSKLRSDLVIAVDVGALFVCQKYFNSTEFLSLEIYPGDPLVPRLDLEKISSVFIQNVPRYKYLFAPAQLKTFYVQNAPNFKESYITTYKREGLVWAGSIVKRFAVLDCLDFIRAYPEYSITLKGGSEKKTLGYIKEEYAQLITEQKIVIDQAYLDNDSFIDFLSHFRIGFCFYSWDLINSSINYQTAPSGKLFMCLAAGVPVIASDIPGFRFIQELKAGVLVKDYHPDTIKNAILTIESDYSSYQEACYNAARFYSFDKNVAPYIKFITDKIETP